VRPWVIKPYPCGAEPDYHEHFANQEEQQGTVTRVDGPESSCPLCTEALPTAVVAA